jgi:hypothetical protein
MSISSLGYFCTKGTVLITNANKKNLFGCKRFLFESNLSYLPGYDPAGISTVDVSRPVAGLHRASPSTTLDKSILFIVFQVK